MKGWRRYVGMNLDINVLNVVEIKSLTIQFIQIDDQPSKQIFVEKKIAFLHFVFFL